MKKFSFDSHGTALVNSKLAFYEKHPLAHTPDILKTAYSCIDLTSLSNADNEKSITALVESVNMHKEKYPMIPNVAGICVYPCFVPLVKKLCKVPEIEIVSVAGGFPHAQTFKELKTEEVRRAAEAGADEIDVVINAGDIIAGNLEKAGDELREMKEAAGVAKLKVILETGVYKYDSDIYDASIVALQAGANFIKTSTGKMSPAATPRAALIMALAVKDFENATGKRAGLKVAGGIRTSDDALAYYQIAKDVSGADSLDKYSFRIGATSLAGNILKELA